MKKISGAIVGDRLTCWAPMLEEWSLLIERYSRAFDGAEHVFDFVERPNIGILSAAAWRSGLLSLEEFGHGKHLGGEEYSGGRCDLWIGTQDLEHQYYVEAKHFFASVDRFDIETGMAANLSRATADAARSSAFDPNTMGVGVCFASIRALGHRISDDTDNIENFIAQCQAMQTSLGFDALAWSFPAEARGVMARAQEHARIGIVMMAKAVRAD